MTACRALVFSEDETEFLYMTRTPDGAWHADRTMLEHWRLAKATAPRLYRLPEPYNTFVTVDDANVCLEWPSLALTEYPQIRTMVERPWLPATEIYLDIQLEEVQAFDIWNRYPTGATVPATWDEAHRPRLMDCLCREPWEFYSVGTPTPVPAPSAPAVMQPQQQPQQQSTTPFPPHVVAAIIAAAVAAGATCPITMEPLESATAAVTPCGHVFQRAALTTWIQQRSRNRGQGAHCPECRHPL